MAVKKRLKPPNSIHVIQKELRGEKVKEDDPKDHKAAGWQL